MEEKPVIKGQFHCLTTVRYNPGNNGQGATKPSFFLSMNPVVTGER